MADTLTVQRKSLWREGLRDFQTNWKGWLSVALVFFICFAALQFYFVGYLGPLQEQLHTLLKDKKDSQAAREFMREHWAPFLSYLAAMIAIIYVQQYAYLSFFMKRTMPASARPWSVGGFFYYFGVVIQMIMLVLLPGIALLALGLILSSLKVPGVAMLPVIGGIVALLGVVYMAVRCLLVMPLAAGGIKHSIKSSWLMSRDNFWRLLGNNFVMFLVLVGFGLLFIFIMFIVGMILGMAGVFANADQASMKQMIEVVFRCIINGLIHVLMTGVMMAYYATACRILYEEKHQADPSFVLVTRS